jgi:hypothetical protein
MSFSIKKSYQIQLKQKIREQTILLSQGLNPQDTIFIDENQDTLVE